MRAKLLILILAVGVLAFGASWALIAQEAEKEEQEAKAYLGVYMKDVDESIVELYSLASSEGAYISSVSHGSPADDAGLRRGDVIIELGGMAVKSAEDLRTAVENHKPSDKVEITLLRKGEMQTLTATLGERKPLRAPNVWVSRAPVFDKRMIVIPEFGRGRLGIQYMELNPDLGDYFGRPEGKGILITKVETETPAEKAGMKAGDVIISVGDRDIQDSEDLRYAISRHEGEEPLQIVVQRHNQQITFEVELEKARHWDFHLRPHEDVILRLKDQMVHLEESLGDIEIPHIEIPDIDVLDHIDIGLDIDFDFDEFDGFKLHVFRDDGECHVEFNDLEFDSLEEFKEYLKSDEFEEYRKKMKEKVKEKLQEIKNKVTAVTFSAVV